MTTTRDQEPGAVPDAIATLTALRPKTPIEQSWSQADQAAARARIMAAGPGSGRASVGTGPRRRGSRATTIAVTGLVLAGGAGAAAAGGVMPQAFTDAFSYWREPAADGVAVDPATAQRVATAPGPEGSVFTVLVAHASDDSGYRCATTVFETPDSTAQPGPAEFEDASGSTCRQGPQDAGFGTATSLTVTGDFYVWETAAGQAVRAELRTASGQAYPVVLTEGTFYGWYPAHGLEEAQAELVGYAADGTEVGRLPI